METRLLQKKIIVGISGVKNNPDILEYETKEGEQIALLLCLLTPSFKLLEEMCGNALLGILEVLNRIEFTREEICDIEDGEGGSFCNKTQESEFVEGVLEVLLVHHNLQLLIERSRVSLSHSLDAETFASCQSWVASLANLGDGAIFVHYDLHFLFPKFVTNEGENILVTVCKDSLNDLSVIEKVAVEQENLFSISFRTSQPKRIDIVGRLVILVVDEAHIDALAISLLDEILDLLVQVARHNAEFSDASLDEGIHRTLQKGSFTYFEETLWRVKCEGTKS